MKRAKEFNILMDDVAITHLSFGTEVWPAYHAVNPELGSSKIQENIMPIPCTSKAQRSCCSRK